MQYFKHMSNMRNDLKIRRVINKFGLEGYGLYCLILETVVEGLATDSPVPDIQETCSDIAEFYNGDTTKINEIASFIINQGLIEIDEVSERITCNKIYKYLESSQTRSKAIKELIESYKKTECLRLSETVPTCTVKKRIDKTRTEEKREEERNPDYIRLTVLLMDCIEENDKHHFTGKDKKGIINKWYDNIRLLIEKDGRSLEEAERIIKWATSNDFWKANILSAAKLREKFSTLLLQAETKDKPSAVIASPTPHVKRFVNKP